MDRTWDEMTGTFAETDRSWDGRTISDVEAEHATIAELEAAHETISDLEEGEMA